MTQTHHDAVNPGLVAAPADVAALIEHARALRRLGAHAQRDDVPQLAEEILATTQRLRLRLRALGYSPREIAEFAALARG